MSVEQAAEIEVLAGPSDKAEVLGRKAAQATVKVARVESRKPMMRDPERQDGVGLYLEEIAQMPLLTAEEEVELSKAIEAGLMAEHVLAGTIDEPLSVEASDDELRAMAELGKQAKAHFIAANLRLVVSIARKHNSKSSLPLLDLIQEGNLGLVRAVEKFDYTKGYKFSTYGTWWVRQSLTRGIADKAGVVRLPVHVSEQVNKVKAVRRTLAKVLDREPELEEIADEMEIDVERLVDLIQWGQEHVSLDAPISEDGSTTVGDLRADEIVPSAEETAISDVYAEQIDEVLSHLDERSRDIVRRRYGLRTGGPENLQDIARDWNITPERVRQLERKAVDRLRGQLGNSLRVS